MRRSTKVLAGAAAMTLAVSGAAYAAIPDSDDGEYHACVTSSTTSDTYKVTYLFDKQAGTNCPSGYTEKVWNQEGPQGPAGATGPQGVTGPQGEPGEDAETPHVKVIKKDVQSGTSGGQFGDTWACPTGYIATAVTWKVTPAAPQGTNDVDVWVTDSRVNPSESNAAEFRFMANSRSINGTSGQVSVEVRGTCVSEVVSDGVSTS